MHDKLFSEQSNLSEEIYAKFADSMLGDHEAFRRCVESGKHRSSIRRSIKEGGEAGVQGTPTLFIGFIDAEQGVLTVRRILRGAHSYAAVKSAIADISLLP